MAINPSLVYEKLLPGDRVLPLDPDDPHESRERSLSDGERKRRLLQALAEYLNETGRPRVQHDALEAARARVAAQLESLRVQGLAARWAVRGTGQWRTVVGLGAANVLETSMLFSRTGGFPVIPGSALKGIARSCALLRTAEQAGVELSSDGGEDTPFARLEAYLEAEEDRDDAWDVLRRAHSAVSEHRSALDRTSMLFRQVFGTQARRGAVLFFDGLPETWPRLDVDTMTVHHWRYYGMEGERDDRQQARDEGPRPIAFLTVGAGAVFTCPVASRDAAAAEQAASWLCDRLQTLGVGAKSRAGYGWMQAEAVRL